MTPKYSIIVPVYNVEDYLRQCLDSVLAQSYGNWECVCVDDGSTDDSGSILDVCAKRDARFRVMHQKNGGEGAARNAALDNAKGQWIVYLDSDDELAPFALETCESMLANDPDVDLLRFCLRRGTEEPDWNTDSFDTNSLVASDLALSIEAGDFVGVNFPQFIYRRSVYGALRFSDYCVGADRVYLAKVLVWAKKRLATSRQCYYYRIRKSSISHVPENLAKVDSFARHIVEVLNIFEQSGREVAPSLVRMLGNEITEEAVYRILSIYSCEDRNVAWKMWYSSMKELLSNGLIRGYRKVTIMVSVVLRLKFVAVFLFAFPHWLKRKGLHR